MKMFEESGDRKTECDMSKKLAYSLLLLESNGCEAIG